VAAFDNEGDEIIKFEVIRQYPEALVNQEPHEVWDDEQPPTDEELEAIKAELLN